MVDNHHPWTQSPGLDTSRHHLKIVAPEEDLRPLRAFPFGQTPHVEVFKGEGFAHVKFDFPVEEPDSGYDLGDVPRPIFIEDYRPGTEDVFL